jgi:cyclopropane fatty-acyl-phospholipid synthase-like methyltransferase
MRVLLLCVLAVAACARNQAEGEPARGRGSAVEDNIAREQARYDAERRPEKVVEALGLRPGARVADIGAGSGLLTVHLARAVAPDGRVVATDIDGAVLDLLAQRLERAGMLGVVERRVVAADTPGLETRSYDAILIAEVDHYFADAAAWLRAAGQALVADGRLVISNRIYHRAQAMASASKAGLVLRSEATPIPTHFIAVFAAPEVQP